MNFTAFPDIGQYRNLIRNVASRAQYTGKDVNGDPIYDPLKPLPVLDFEGTVKLHGTNSAIGFNRIEDAVWFQSRENIITFESDNAGFARQFTVRKTDIVQKLIPRDSAIETIIYGEWCGKGIQKGVGINELPKMFVVFAVKVDGVWKDREFTSKFKDAELHIYNIYDYPSYKITIDFNHPEESQNKLCELTQAVENECPVANAFGVKGVGEGIVWKCVTPGWEDSKFWMKVKGKKHTVSKTKTLAPIDTEKVRNQQEFVDNVVTETRCLQSISKLREAGKPLNRTSLGEFLRWIYNDIIKEEFDTAKANGIDINKIGSLVSRNAKTWFFKNESTFLL